MFKQRWVLLIGILLLLSACNGENTDNPLNVPSVPVESGTRARFCGDGLCENPENAINCAIDCNQPGPLLLTPTAYPTEPLSGDVPPIYFFYAIHVHGSDENLPYDDPDRNTINPQIAENMIAAIEDIAKVLDKYGVKGTWEILPATATGLCSYQGESHIFNQLITNGHEIGTHAHRIDDIKNAYQALQDDCGIRAKTSSGFITQISSYDTDVVQSAMSLSIQTALDLGMTIGTTNLSPGGGKNPFSELCHDQIGVGNTMWERSGNLMFPWKPDVIHRDICAHDAMGEMVFIDHVSIEWIILPGQEAVPDVLTDQNFNQLEKWFDGALQVMQEEKPQRIAVWGFVTHLTEYAVGSKVEHTLEPGALLALEKFLEYVESKRIEGRVIYATVSEIADLILADR